MELLLCHLTASALHEEEEKKGGKATFSRTASTLSAAATAHDSAAAPLLGPATAARQQGRSSQQSSVRGQNTVIRNLPSQLPVARSVPLEDKPPPRPILPATVLAVTCAARRRKSGQSLHACTSHFAKDGRTLLRSQS